MFSARRVLRLCATIAVFAVIVAPVEAQSLTIPGRLQGPILQPANPFEHELVADVRVGAEHETHTEVVCSIKNIGRLRTGLFIAHVHVAQLGVGRGGYLYRSNEFYYPLDLEPGEEWTLPSSVAKPSGYLLAARIAVEADVQDVIPELIEWNNADRYANAILGLFF